MNPLLVRQLRKHMPPGMELGSHCLELLKAVSAAYDEFEGECRLLEHTLEVTSEELNEANERLRRDSEDKIRALSSHYLHTLECQQGMILRVAHNQSGFVHTLCRGKLAMRLGWSPDRVEGRRAAEFASARQAPELEAIYERVWHGEVLDLEQLTPDGSLVWLAHFQPLRHGDEICEIIVSAVDITERKQSEIALVSAKERAETADKAKSEFLAVMSHEIRTPLNAVLGFNSLLQDSSLSEDQRSWVETIDTSGRSLLSLLNDILDFSKVEAGQLHFSLQPFDLHALLDSVIALHHPAATQRGIGLGLRTVAGLPRLVSTDQVRLRQILNNLVSNAVKFTHVGEVTLTAAVSPDSGNPAGGVLRVAVCDSGIGIDARHHERLFKPFSQVDASNTRQYGGTGLGLAISQRLARALGGDISFTSSPGRGSTFTLRIPITMQAVVTHEQQTVVPVRVGVGHLRVLVAEDNPSNRELVLRILSARGVRPDMVDNGADAVRAAQESSYDVIFMDVRMPGIDGLDATRQIRSALAGRRMPRIVAVTANAFDEEKRLCLESGMDAVVLKPFVAAELMRQLEIACGLAHD